MNLKRVVIDGQSFDLGTLIGKGGEGEVYAIQKDPNLALKVYTTQDRFLREAKVHAMISLGLSSKTSLVAFPVSIARTSEGKFLGFVMRLVGGHKPLHDLYSPGSRKNNFPQADYRFLVRTATNIAKAVASVHKAGCVIGDINHSSMLISSKAVVALIDADSFQITSGANQYLCKVGVPEYTPPELQGINLSSVVRTPNHDAFGLAIVIFQILFMGRHPFVGTVRTGDIPPLHENIKNFKYVYTEQRNVGMDQPPGTPSISDFSPKLAEYFDKAFLQSSQSARPSAENWVTVLEELENSLVKCDENPLHFIPKGATECAWCDMERQLSTILFLPYYPGAIGSHEGQDPGAINFNIELIWRQIDAVKIPEKIEPRITSYAPSPSASAQSAKPSWFAEFNSPIIGGLAAIAVFILPQLIIVWAGVLWWAFSKSKSAVGGSATSFIKSYQDVDRRWHQEIENWHQRTGVKAFLDLKKELSDAKDAYKAASLDEQKQIQKYRSDRMERQLNAYLDSFDISKAKVKGIGAAKEAALASYGITTAADISRARLLSVPGFGDATSQPLLTWRESLVKKFIYQLADNEVDRQEITKIKYATQSKLSALRKKLSSGVVNLATMAQRVKSAITIEDPLLKSLNQQKAQLRSDIVFLGGSIPAYNPPAKSTSVSQPQYSPGRSTPTSVSAQTRNTATSSTSVSCPRCGSSMVKRLARRGRNSGNYFWGCSRYPKCKGTRN